jgi:uncharacterized repeat protein (TIGR03806 family)
MNLPLVIGRALTLLIASIFIISCGSDDYTPVSPVQADLTKVPYPKLSDYKFFEGDMKDMNPALKVIPYDLNSTLFTDYAHKKRFVWIPAGKKASYSADGKILEFPTGSVLIKSFYYDNVLPENKTVILETRLMIKKDSGWIFADYIWNDEQTEAVLDMSGGTVNLRWMQDGAEKTTNYNIPPAEDCLTCHKTRDTPIPIGPKPQNLNKDYTYADKTENQLERWIKEGYLDTKPQNITSTIDWTDESKPLELRVRSYLDINCAHCHSEDAHCSYRVMRFAFSETENSARNLGICVSPQEDINPILTYIVAKRVPNRSALFYRINSTSENVRMPLLGRTMQHTEAVNMIRQWITEMDANCQ